MSLTEWTLAIILNPETYLQAHHNILSSTKRQLVLLYLQAPAEASYENSIANTLIFNQEAVASLY